MSTPTMSWLARAKSFLRLAEYPGAKTNPTIAGWLAKLKAAWRDDETAWCGTFVADCFLETGITPVKGWAGARNWINFGVHLTNPAVGCVAVFWRDTPSSGKGHVGFVVGKDALGNLMLLAGNQGNAVTIKPISKARLVGYRWPAGVPLPLNNTVLPLIASDGKLSTAEA